MTQINTQNLYKNAFGDEYFNEINSNAFDNVGSTSTFNKVFKDVLSKENTLYIIVGSDSGLLVPYLQKYHAGKGRHYLILERPELIEHIRAHYDVDEKLIELETDDLDFSTLVDKYTEYVAHQRFMLLRSLAVIDSRNELYQQMWEVSLDKYNIFSTSESGYAINNIFIDSQLRNLSISFHPLAKAEQALKGTTSIIMGGGPSLDESIDWIKQNQEKLVIFAAARIANRLKKEGIQPDFFVTVDPHPVSYDNSKQMLQFGDSAILVHANNANSKLIAEWSGAHAYLGLVFPWIDSFHPQADNLSIVGPTVTNTMASVASFLGSDQVIFSGVDFCYGENGKSYESDSVETKTGKYLDTATNRVETYSGRIAETTPSFANARQGMEEFITVAMSEFGTEFYTLSQEAALIENVAFQEMDAVQLPATNKYDALTNIKNQLRFEMNDYVDHLKAAKKYCQEMRTLCKDVAKEARQGKKVAKKLFDNLDETDDLTQKVIRSQRNAQSIMGEHAEFIFNYSIKAYEAFMNPSVEKENMTRDEIKASFIHYFDGLINSAIPLRKSIEAAIERLNHRVNETKWTQKLDPLVEKWAEYHEEGRPYVWLNMNQKTWDDLTPEQQAKIEPLLETYQSELNATETKLSIQLKNQGDSIATTFERIRRYFAENRLYELQDVINYIAESDNENAKDLCHIGTGFLYELKDMLDDAVNEYVQIEEKGLLLEGLKRVVSITLSKKDYNTALNALEVLTHYSDEYFIAYADILAAMGDVQGAVEIYFHYLQGHDKDAATWIKVAKLLIHIKAYEEAVNAVQKILKLEPENQAAHELLQMATDPQKH